MALLAVDDLTKIAGKNEVVKNISFQQNVSEKIAIAGATGSGKTTLLKMIAGLIQPTFGNIFLENKRVIGPDEQLLPGNKHIAYLSQHFELRNNYKVYELLEMQKKIADEDAQKIYKVCRIAHLLKRRTDSLSGGERQRIVLASLLTASPKLLLLDEPFSNLDRMHKIIIQSVIHDIGQELNITSIMVSHDAADLLSWADKIIIMKDGSFIQEGTPQEVYHQPINEYAAGLLGQHHLISKKLANALGINSDKKQIIVRPEQFKITLPGNAMLSGVIQRTLFFGNHYLLEVMIEDELISVRVNEERYVSGEMVYLSFQDSSR